MNSPRFHRHQPAFLLALFLMWFASGTFAASAKKPITHDVYDGWRSIRDTKISNDGTWLVYALVPQDGDGELVALNVDTGKGHRHPRGTNPQISYDGRFVVFTVKPKKADLDEAKKQKKKAEDQPKDGLGIMDLSTGAVVTFDRVQNFKLPKESGRFVAYLLEPETIKKESTEEKAAQPEREEGQAEKGKKEKKPGTNLVLRQLDKDNVRTFSGVVEYAWSTDGRRLAFATSSATPAEDGVSLWDTETEIKTVLMSGQGNYKGAVFDKRGEQLAFLSDREAYQNDQPTFKLYAWSNGSETARELVSETTPNFRPNTVVSEHGSLEFSDDGNRLFLGTAPKPSAERDDAPEPIKVDIWHWRDPELQTMQKVRAEAEKKRSYQAVIHLQDRVFAQLATATIPDFEPGNGARWGLGSSNRPYAQLISWDGTYRDHYLVNLKNGSSLLVVEKAEFGATLSPAANYVLYYDATEKDWFTYQLSDGKTINLTGHLEVSFEDEIWDRPSNPRPYGVAGWTDDDAAVLLYDRFDIWEFRPDGSNFRNVTEGLGRREQLVFRYNKLDQEEKTIPTSRPLWISTRDDRTKASGYYQITLDHPGTPRRVVMLDKQLDDLEKAKNADRYVFTMSTFEEFPDLWVAGPTLTDRKKVSEANPQQREFRWGRAELIDYLNTDGKRLQAVLIKPEDFDPEKKYPMMVYIYERLSNGLHRYVAPAPGTSINVTRYVSNGYVVLMPDIVYDTGYPGESAMKCVLPAVQKVIEMGFVHPERIGIQGHSWGGYQISYMITRTNLFRAVQAGASVVNMISAYGGIRWGSGMSRAFQYEKTQSRIGAPPWERSLQFIENSPLFWVEKVQTPYLTIHNDGDDAVPWYQGIEFFSALRRLGKEAYMFNYNDERHGLRQRENQKHWTLHMTEFFDHLLKDESKPEWMEKGVPYLERGTRDIRPYFERKSTDSP